MDEGAPFTDQVSSGRRRTVVIIVVAIMILAAVALVVILSRGPDPRIAAELDELRAMGRPVSIADFGQPPMPDAENAALVYNEAFKLLPELSPEDGEILSDFAAYWESVSEESLQRIRELVAAAAEGLALIEEGNRRPKCYFKLDWQKGYEARMPHLGYMRRAAHRLIARARLRAMDGDLSGAVADLRTSLALGAPLHGQPAMISELVALVFESLSAVSIQHLCDDFLLSADMLHSLEEELANVPGRAVPAYTMGTERVLAFETIRKVRNGELSLPSVGGEPERKSTLLDKIIQSRIDYDNEELTCIRLLGQIEGLMDEPLYESAARLKKLSDELNEKLASDKLLLMGLLTPATFRFREEVAVCGARVQVTRMGLAALAWRLEHGEWPEKPPLDLVDPFDGKPMRYRVGGETLVIYSIGRDLLDDSGTRIEPGSGTDDKGDIVWELRAPGSSVQEQQ